MTTTQEQIDVMRSMCSTLASKDLVETAYVDDWGRFGNFQIMLKPRLHDRHTTQRIRALVKKALPPGAHLREVFGPDPIREYNRWTGKNKVVGYSRDFWVIDVDYHEYQQESNTFGRAYA